MNSRFVSTPEIIATIESVDGNGNETYVGDRVVGIVVKKADHTGVVTFDIRDIKQGRSLAVTIELSELLLAVSRAAINRST